MVQNGNMSEVCLARLLSECLSVCMWVFVCVCVSQVASPALCLVAFRDGAGLASC